MNEKILSLKNKTQKYFYEKRFDDKAELNSIIGQMPNYDLYLKRKAKSKLQSSNVAKELRMFYAEPLLSFEQEKHLFSQFNYYKHRVQKTIANTKISEEDKENYITKYYKAALKVRDQLISCNLRLVASAVKKNTVYTKNPNLDVFSQLVSDAILGLHRAIEGFDHRKGFKFSTYATWAVKRSLWKKDKKTVSSSNIDESLLYEAVDYRQDGAELSQKQEYIRSLLRFLSPVQQEILTQYYLEGKKLREIASDRKVTKERIRQIKAKGIEKIRSLFSKAA